MKLKQKFVLFLSALFVLMSISVTVSADHVFDDIPSSMESHDEIDYIYSRNIIKGYQEGGKTFYKPGNNVTRSQAAKMLVIATGHSPLVKAKSSFPDVQVGTEASGYIEQAVALGFFGGYANGKFGPNDPLTRGQMSAILTEAFDYDLNEYAGYLLPFSDISSKHYYVKYIKALYYNGITQGDSGKFNSGNSVTRGQFALFVARALNDKFKLKVSVVSPESPDTGSIMGKVKVTTDGLNIRTGPGISYPIVGVVNTGQVFEYYEVDGNWVKISHDDQYAYISTDFIQYVDINGDNVGSEIKKVITTTDLNVRSFPDAVSNILGAFKPNAVVSVYGQEGNWYLVKIDGKPGYINSSYTKAYGSTINSDLMGKVTVDTLYVRSGPGASYSSLGKLSKGDMVEVKSIDGFWAKIVYKGSTAYTHKTYLKLLNQDSNVLKDRIIVIDAGHGGTDPGAVRNSAQEKDIVLKVAKIVQQKLANSGAKVVMTRESDVYPTLQGRVNLAKKSYGEIFVSIHVNASASSSAKGTETYYDITINDNSAESRNLATQIQSQIVKNADMYDRKVKTEAFYVIRNMNLPSVLVELGFISNSADYNKLTNDKYVNIYADSIYNGIYNYYSKP